jgi:SAM-dependent methyltransferase
MSTAVQRVEVPVESHAGAAFFCRELDRRGFAGTGPSRRILIAGCGLGHEAAAIHSHYDAAVDGIDLDMHVEPQWREAPGLTFQAASVCDLPFDDDTFDAVFYHHVIEHVDNPAVSLAEIARVLKPGGWLFVGTPNRHRLFSSVGSHRQLDWEATFGDKLKDNWHDWKARFKGRFRNEHGAHAGFSRSELDRMLAAHFDERVWLTGEYLRFKYANHRYGAVVRTATLPGVAWFLAPSVYALCRKPLTA